VSLNISEFFDKSSGPEWLSAALKSLKLEELSDFEKKLNYKTCEGVILKSNYEDMGNSISLSTFPEKRKLVRLCDQVKTEDINEGIDLIYGLSDLAHPQYSKIITSPVVPKARDLIDFLSVFINSDKNIEKLKEYLHTNTANQILIRSSIIHNAGGSIVQELSFILSCLKLIETEKLTTLPVLIELSIDSLYFNNISKLRALRFIAESLQEQCGLGEFQILTASSKREQTLYDPWMNMLRNTTSAAAAFLGGADQISISSYDSIAEDFSEYTAGDIGIRQSRNIFHILNEESFLGNVQDAGRGSYVLESLTKQYIEMAFEKFKQFELNGGVLSEITKFSHEIETISHERQKRIFKVQTSIAGVNNFTNTDESLKTLYQSEISMNKNGKDLFPIRRNTKSIEELRQNLESEKLDITILAYGPENKLSGRLMFCANYFEILGKKCAVKFVEKEEDLNEFSGDAFILCSTDDLYDKWSGIKTLKKKKPLFIAGKKYKIEGFQNIYMGQNVFEVLQNNFGSKI
jgi:methylmalonyl-CoA mutase